ncbi:MAG: Uma2 family endonuclease [Xanthobacteraceae bacterium]
MNSSTDSARAQSAPVSLATFRAFVATRPAEERWELIDGVAMMMAPPTKTHQRIASNLQRLLLVALDVAAPHLTAYQRVGVNIGPSVANYDPEPDVAVVDAAIDDLDERYADRFYLVAEIVSESDSGTAASKGDIYKLHPDCLCLLTIRQDRVDICCERRSPGGGWVAEHLTSADAILDLPPFGLCCRLSDIYRGTPLLRAGR